MTTFPIRVQIRLYGEREVSCRACGKPFRPNEWVWCVGQGRHGKYKYECDECFEKVILVYPMRTNMGAKA